MQNSNQTAEVRSSNRELQVGDRAPDFTLTDQSGKPVRLNDLIGTAIIVLYFYPKDESAGCTIEACTFRDNYEDFTKAGATVIGVSPDDAESHQSFISKQHLPFTLLSDPGGKVQSIYGVKALLGILPGRLTYVIDKQGIIRQAFSSRIDMKKHVSEALKVIQSLQG